MYSCLSINYGQWVSTWKLWKRKRKRTISNKIHKGTLQFWQCSKVKKNGSVSLEQFICFFFLLLMKSFQWKFIFWDKSTKFAYQWKYRRPGNWRIFRKISNKHETLTTKIRQILIRLVERFGKWNGFSFFFILGK